MTARPLTPADIARVAERVRLRFVRWFLRKRLLDADAAADMLAWENSGFSVDAGVRITLVDRDVPSSFKSLEHLPRHWRGQWVGPGRKRKATAPGEHGGVDLLPEEFLDRLADLVTQPRKHRHRYHGVFAPNHPLTPAGQLGGTRAAA